jgi:hypothetical protein
MPFPIQDQKNTLWCWAAVASSVDSYFQPVGFDTQVEVAKKVLSHTDCDQEPTPPGCNREASLRLALEQVGRFDRLVNDPLPFKQIVDERKKNLVVCARVQWRNGRGHFVVISGYILTESGQEWVVIKDPLFDDVSLPYEDFCNGYRSGEGKWTHSYLVKP